MEKEFCLLYEPWIRVMKMDGETIEVSLLDVFRYAPELLRLAGTTNPGYSYAQAPSRRFAQRFRKI